MVALSVYLQGDVGFRVRAVSTFWEVECYVQKINDMLVDMLIYIYIYGWRVSQRDVHYLHYASLTAHSLSTLVTPQCNPTMCNRTSCAQVHELP